MANGANNISLPMMQPRTSVGPLATDELVTRRSSVNASPTSTRAMRDNID